MIYECRSCSTYPNRNGDGQQGEGGTSLEVYSMIASHDEYHYNGCIHNWQLETHTVEQEDIIYHIQIYTIYIRIYTQELLVSIITRRVLESTSRQRI